MFHIGDKVKCIGGKTLDKNEIYTISDLSSDDYDEPIAIIEISRGITVTVDLAHLDLVSPT